MRERENERLSVMVKEPDSEMRSYFMDIELMISILDFNEAIANGKTRRRYGPATAANTKSAISEVTEKSKSDQAVAASSHTEASQYRRGGAYSTDAGDYSYNNADLNLIRPESKPLHTKITAKYTSSISIPADSLEDTETAEEYVAKAMGMYGSRLREPIRIPSETEVTPATAEQQPSSVQQLTTHTRHYGEHEQEQQQQLQQHHEQSQQHPHHHHYPQEQDHSLQNIHEHVEKPEHYEYYSFSHKDAQRPQAPIQTEEEPQGPPPSPASHQQYQYISQVQAENEAAKAMLEAQMQAQLQEQLKQAQYAGSGAEQQESEQQQQQQEVQPQAEESQGNSEVESNSAGYDKDPVTRSYNIYEDHTEAYEGAPSHLERNYRTKYLYKPVSSSSYHSAINENEEKIRVSASTEIPKAEIMKQIEKSVMRYMKELEAEGKIIAAPKSQEPKTYFKVVTVPGTEEKRIAASSTKSKYSSPPNNYGGETYKHSIVHSEPIRGSGSPSSSGSSKYNKNQESKNAFVLENESTYQSQGHEVTDVLAPNVEFIYKIKTKAPLHTATVKTVSKPYSLPLKPSYDQFDHSTALKNLEDFDLSHVVTTPDPDEHQSISSASSNKPSKLYFNSEIYHDINSMSYKQKQQQQRGENEYRPEYRKKSVSNQEPHPDYKGYSTATSGYYAEPPTAEGDRDISGSGMSEDGYPSIMSPYQQYVLKKEPLSGKYEAEGSFEQPRSHHKYKNLDFDSYNPKYNNNPEGYGYQQTYKTHLTRSHAPGKRGKRGGAPHPSQTKKLHRNSNMKEFEANIALRPPPKV
ncbi:probable basic-leucine zipper transcription factor Q [Musca vetustissima]|uniref:probable basic-leucine zipper transcription factor Q n=1 Tax=Musca vetustissima TaxID=27455 RepID=UPI002AB724E1|nr:probable basic-leucine zipper transcription factor Q [Musca vetustissima]